MELKLKRLINLFGVEVIENANGQNLTSFKSGGKVNYLFRPCDTEGLLETLNYVRAAGEKFDIIGNGTKVLIADGGYDGALITLKRMKNVSVSGDKLSVSGGVSMPVAAAIARDNNLSGLEFYGGIPGSIGGAVRMNAGAYGAETADYLYEIEVLNGDTVEIKQPSDMEFCYRNSNVNKNGWLVLGASYKLNYCDRDKIADRMKTLSDKRNATQPDNPSAGSTFKRAGGVSPAVYIEKAGLKGLSHGGAQISEKHANFIINKGSATTNDYIALAETAAEKVYDKFSVRLEYETRIIGEK